jgi:hypothetical protein
MPYKSHEIMQEPQETQSLWRYMDFSKFVALMQTKNLFFSPLTRLEDDPWEGLPSKKNFDPELIVRIQDVGPSSTDGSIVEGNLPTNIRFASLKNLFGDHLDDFLEEKKQSAFKLRNLFSVSCWHMNDDESDSQWKIYGSSPCALAIVTSFKRLREAIIDSHDVYGSKVIYYNPSKTPIPEGNAFLPVMFKRQAFIHEREFRLINCNFELINSKTPPTGIPIAVDLDKLIESVVISPRAPQWFTDVVERFITDSGFSIPISKSNLLESPI